MSRPGARDLSWRIRAEELNRTLLRPRSNKDKDDIHSRAYILFKSPDALVAFHRAYDGWNFRDKTGKRSITMAFLWHSLQARSNALILTPRSDQSSSRRIRAVPKGPDKTIQIGSKTRHD